MSLDNPVNPPAPAPAPAPVAAPVFDPQAAIAGLVATGHRVYAKDFEFDPSVQTDDPFIKTIVGKTTSTIYVGEDRDIFEKTGIPKIKDEKTYDYRNRAFSVLKDQIQQAPDVEKVKQEYETQLSKKDQAIAEISLVSALSALKLNVPDEALESQRELLVMRALALPHRIEGRDIVFQKYGGSDGQTLIDVVDPVTQEPMKPGKFLEAQFKAFLAVENPTPQGPGAKPKPANTSSPIPTNMDEIGAQLLSEGFRPGPVMQAEAKKRATEYMIKQ